MSAEKKQNGGEERRLSAPFSNLFPRHKEPVPSSASLPSISTAVSSSHTEAGGHEELLQDKLDPATKFAYADLLIAILRLDFLREGDRPSAEFCGTAVEIILKWANLPEKTNETLRHHMEDEGSVNDDFITLIDVIKNDEKLQKAGLPTLFGSLLIAVIEGGTYDSRFRVLLRHTSALLGVSWTKFEELEETLADRLLHDFVESESPDVMSDESRQTRERLAKSKRLKRYALIGAAGGLGAVLIGLTGGLAAPFVATGIGAITASTAFAGLATTTGAAIFGSIFGVAGGGLAGYRMKKRVGAIEEFVVESLTDSTHSSLRCVLCISGWIKENDKGAFKKPWRHLWMAKEQYTLRYESMYLAEWNSAMEYFVTAVVGYAIQRSLMETILAGVFSAIAWPMVLISSSSVIDNPWSVCFSRAVDVGEYLAEVILSRAHGKRPISLIGFSVGARVIYHCLLAMSKRKNSLGLIEDVVLLGAPVSASPQQWKQISSVVAGRVINGYCKTDWLLRFLYRTASVQFNIAGTGPVDNRHEKKIVNYNLSHIIKGHTEYLDKLADVLDAVGIRVTPLSKSSQNNLRKFEEEHAISDMPGDESREKDGQAKENVSDANEETENPERTREHRQRESCDRDGAAILLFLHRWSTTFFRSRYSLAGHANASTSASAFSLASISGEGTASLSAFVATRLRRDRFAMKRGYTLKNHSNIFYGNFRARPSLNGSRQLEMDLEKIYNAMEKGHKVCKLLLLKKWDPSYKKLLLNRDTQQIVLSKFDSTLPSSSAPSVSSVAGVAATKPLATLDVRLIKEAHSLDYKLNTIRVADRWRKDKDIQRFNAEMILVISYGSAFVLNHWILLFESKDTCRLWADGINNLRREIASTSHYLLVERWLRKQFHSIVNSDTSTVTLKHMRPFVQTKLQCKVQSKQLQEIAEGEMGFEAFATAHNRLLNFDAIFVEKFAEFGEKPNADAADAGAVVSLVNFVRFINEAQGDELGRNVEAASNFLRHYLRDVDLSRDVLEPHLTSEEFVDFLYSSENSIFNPLNNEVVQDMTRPLTHYWIASSHNTYLTGDQLRSESSLEAYSRALIMGCRCIELDCWDGQRKMSGEFSEIVIYHGYTMTSKLNLRDVLYTIKHYAFMTSRYPLILSIENNCSVPAQRKMAQDIKEILGDFLLVAPVSRDEWQLPSPEAMRNKIILKHKKLQLDDDALISAAQSVEEELDQDLLSKECIKRGVLYLRDNTKHLWSRHIFLLFSDRLCYILRPVENEDLCARDPRDDQQTEDESGSVGSWQDSSEDQLMSVFGVRPEEMHITEEWFHGKVGRDVAKDRLMEHADKGNGVFLVRESGTFIGDYTLSFFQNGNINHCRIKTAMVDGNKKFYFFDNLKRDTLYELISHYTRHAIDAPSFKAYLLTPCPQPQPHLNEPWFSGEADKQRAEELLSTVKEDGAFLIRYSASDRNVFVLSLRVNGEFWHYRLKRDGRIFVVNQMIFENLNQIVDFYSNRDFVRGICLKYPINERTMGRYARNDGLLASSGCYMELKDLDKEEEVISIKSFLGVNVEHLSFPAGVRIQVLARNADLWKGRYLGRMGWFPADCVQPVHNENDEAAAEAAMSYETIELGGSVFARCESDRPFAFRVTQSTSPWNVQEYIVATESREEMDEWLNAMHSAARTFNDRINLLRFKEKQLRIASELSSLVVYCQAVPFNADFALSNPRQSFYEMCSFSESKHDKLLEKGLALFNTRQLSRVYPQASRLTSTNFNPTPMWNSGCHMVALNYQTGDRSMQLNYGKFSANGRCGYVLKPQYMMDETFRLDPLAVPQAQTVDVVSSTNGLQKSASMANACENFPICLTLQIIAGRHLAGKDHTKGICSPFVQVEVTGFACDSRVERTNTITSNGLNPMWNETMVFNVLRPEVALLRFLVEDGDFVGPKTDPFIGQAVFPMDCIRGGYRSIPLLNQFNEPLELSALLVHVRIRSLTNVPVRNLHAHLQAGRLAAAANNHSNNNNALSAELAEEPEASVPHTLADLTPATLGATPSSATLLSPSDATTPSTRRHSATTLLHASSTRLNNDAAPTAGHGIDAVLSSAASTPDQSPSQTTSMDSYDDNAPITGSMSSTISSVKKPSSNALRRIFRIGRNT